MLPREESRCFLESIEVMRYFMEPLEILRFLALSLRYDAPPYFLLLFELLRYFVLSFGELLKFLDFHDKELAKELR